MDCPTIGWKRIGVPGLTVAQQAEGPKDVHTECAYYMAENVA